MNQINKLKQEITDIEDQAGQLEHEDYEALYKLLANAYFKAKDIIELQEGNIPIVKDDASEVALHDARSTIATLEVALDVANEEVSTLHTSLSNIKDEATALSHGIRDILNLAD